jgi:hypothetical protein
VALHYTLIQSLQHIERETPRFDHCDVQAVASLRALGLVSLCVGETLSDSVGWFADLTEDPARAKLPHGFLIWVRPTEPGRLVLEAFKIGRSVGHVEREPEHLLRMGW